LAADVPVPKVTSFQHRDFAADGDSTIEFRQE
jgi:hypothetical protein